MGCLLCLSVCNADSTGSAEGCIARAGASVEARLYDIVMTFAGSAHTYLRSR